MPKSSLAAASAQAAKHSASETSPSRTRRACSPVVRSIRSVNSGLRRRDAEALVARVGRRGEGPLARGRGARLVGPEDVHERDDVRGRLDAGEVELPDALDVLE